MEKREEDENGNVVAGNIEELGKERGAKEKSEGTT